MNNLINYRHNLYQGPANEYKCSDLYRLFKALEISQTIYDNDAATVRFDLSKALYLSAPNMRDIELAEILNDTSRELKTNNNTDLGKLLVDYPDYFNSYIIDLLTTGVDAALVYKAIAEYLRLQIGAI